MSHLFVLARQYKPNLQQVSFHHIDTWIHLTTQLAARLKGPSGSVISIRGTVPTASSSSASRMAGGSPTTSRIPRLRNVIVEPSTRASGGAPSVDLLRQVVTRRWDPQTQFLNLEVRGGVSPPLPHSYAIIIAPRRRRNYEKA